MSFAILKVNLTGASVVWRQNFHVYSQKWKTEIAAALIEPIFTFFALAFGVGSLIGVLENGIKYITFIGAGILSFTVLMNAFLELTYNSYSRMVYDEKFDEIIKCGINPETLAFGEIFWGVSKALIHCFLIFPILLIFGGMSSFYAVFSVLPLTLGCFLLGGFSFGITCKIYNAENFKFVQAVFFSSILLCGVWFPLDILPIWLQIISHLIPLTAVIDLVRACFIGKFTGFNLLELIYLFVLSIIYLEFSLRSLKKRLQPV